MNLDYNGIIETDCGKRFRIDVFDQLAVGVIQCDNFLKDPSFIPSTFSLYKTFTGLYLLQVTVFNLESDNLETNYTILSEAEALVYLENCCTNI